MLTLPTFSFGPCAKRSPKPEPIELPDLPEEDLEKSLSFIEMLNHWTGGNEIILNFFEHSARRWATAETISILEIGCLRGELSRTLTDWFRMRKIGVRIFSIDENPRLIEMARKKSMGYNEITHDTKSLRDPQFLHAQQFDYVISAQALHREKTADAILYLKKMNFLARRGLIISDWTRDIRALTWMTVFSWFVRNDAIQAGAQLAIKKGFSNKEIKKMSKEAGVEYLEHHLHFGYRFSLCGERAYLGVKSPIFAIQERAWIN